jgi:ferritin
VINEEQMESSSWIKWYLQEQHRFYKVFREFL